MGLILRRRENYDLSESQSNHLSFASAVAWEVVESSLPVKLALREAPLSKDKTHIELVWIVWIELSRHHKHKLGVRRSSTLHVVPVPMSA